MKPTDLVIKGYAKQYDSVWVAICLDFCLSSQGDTAEEAIKKMHEQTREYVYDALAGEDQDHTEHLLLNRKAPLSQWITYYRLKTMYHVFQTKKNMAKVFQVPLPLPLEHPSQHAH